MISELIKRHKLGIAFLGDIAVFLLSMLLVLYARYGNAGFSAQLSVHLEPFIVVLILWLIIFHIFNLYTYKAFSNILEIAKSLTSALLISFFVTITIFYIFSRFFELTPKANLILLTIVFGILNMLWRYMLMKAFLMKEYCSKVLMLASSPLTEEIIDFIGTNPQLGYSVQRFDGSASKLGKTIQDPSIEQVVVDGKYLRSNAVTKTLYGTLSRQIEITTLTDFYERLFRCIPLSEIEEGWFIREITENKSIYESTKHVAEIVMIFIALPVILPLCIIIGCLVAATSPGPIIYKQERIGKNNKHFILYKFRTMRIGMEGPLWTTENDSRVTPIGRFLRYTHFDEMPQLMNVLKGDISFIGPRPERAKLAKIYEEIPYYEMRHIIKPGIIGWAQLNYKASTTIAEAEKKFQFDLYYIKNRSYILDIFIILKTARTFFVRNT